MLRMQRNTTAACVTAAALLALSGAALGQNCPNGVDPAQCNPMGTCNGPDVIVGDLTGPANYEATGGLDSGVIEAFSLGTTSCNIGDVWLTWFPNTNEHPVIGQSLFKLKTQPGGYTTFEQIGQSWLKHGFFALSQGLCCSGCQTTNGRYLGVHCSDPYTAARNGTQEGLGPKWQVNAATGHFTFPPANPSWSGTAARRLQVPISRLEASSEAVRYFASAQYVTPDDAAAGNKYNNESYRACNMTGSGTAWNLSFSGPTQRAQQGIRAWGNTVEGVVESDVFIPEDGLVIVAAQATDLGNGMWHYEYAVQNMNSDRSVGGFTIPVPAGVMVTNIGFHDVSYHSGDGPGNVNYSGADWIANMTNGSVSEGAISWTTEDYESNQSANAIRWGTLYNFRFDANVPPIDGGAEATLTLFKPGTPTSINSSAIPAPGMIPPTECPCDHNEDGVMNSQDFFDFTGDFFNNAPGADYNGDQLINSQDFFDFLGCFFAPPKGCV